MSSSISLKTIRFKSFFELFKTAASILTEAHQHKTLSLEQQHDIEDTRDSLKNILAALFAHSWSAYLGIKAEQQLQLKSQEFAETSFKKTATAPVVMYVDQITLDLPALKKLVSREITSKTK
jgi:hypothetical protein